MAHTRFAFKIGETLAAGHLWIAPSKILAASWLPAQRNPPLSFDHLMRQQVIRCVLPLGLTRESDSVFDDDNSDSVHRVTLLNRINNILTFKHLAKDTMAIIEMWARNMRNEEL